MLLYSTTGSMRHCTACSVRAQSASSYGCCSKFDQCFLCTHNLPSGGGTGAGLEGIRREPRGKIATRVEFSVCLVLHEAAHFHRIDQSLGVCLVLHEAAHFHRIDQALDDADITLHTRRRHAGNGVVWSAACAASLRLPRQS